MSGADGRKLRAWGWASRLHPAARPGAHSQMMTLRRSMLCTLSGTTFPCSDPSARLSPADRPRQLQLLPLRRGPRDPRGDDSPGRAVRARPQGPVHGASGRGRLSAGILRLPRTMSATRGGSGQRPAARAQPEPAARPVGSAVGSRASISLSDPRLRCSSAPPLPLRLRSVCHCVPSASDPALSVHGRTLYFIVFVCILLFVCVFYCFFSSVLILPAPRPFAVVYHCHMLEHEARKTLALPAAPQPAANCGAAHAASRQLIHPPTARLTHSAALRLRILRGSAAR